MTPRRPARTILVTGASSGIGAALARAYAEPGKTLVLCGRNAGRLEETAAAVRQRGGEARLLPVDLRDADAMLAAFAAADGETPIDCAILNAGLGDVRRPGEAAEAPASARDLADVNFRAPIVGASFFARAMAARGGGRIALMSSFAGFVPIPASPVYSATKAGLILYAHALAAEAERQGVSVTVLCPSFVDTPMSRSLKAAKPFMIGVEQAARRMKAAIDAGRRELVLPPAYAVLRRLLAPVPNRLIARAMRGARASRPD